ncbi:MAG: protein disulfide oxidoreductase [Sulfurovaceae bacterium]|nr:protein disulfide oxidoreductase [Sulfurovaceae bacterium]
MKKWSIKNIIKELIITLLMIFVISMGLNYLRKPNTDIQLPDIVKRDINNQKIVFETYGKPVVIHFWTTWCPTCKLEAPNIESMKDDVHIITIAVNSGTDEELQKFMKEKGYTYTVINDNKGKLAKKFGVQAYPTTFIYDGSGKLQFSEVGYSTRMGIRARVALIND